MMHCDLRVRWKVASDLRFRAAISEPKIPSFCGFSGDLAPSTRKSLAIAIVRFWCAKRIAIIRAPRLCRLSTKVLTCTDCIACDGVCCSRSMCHVLSGKHPSRDSLSDQRAAKGASGKGPRQNTSKNVKKCQNHFSTLSTFFGVIKVAERKFPEFFEFSSRICHEICSEFR